MTSPSEGSPGAGQQVEARPAVLVCFAVKEEAAPLRAFVATRPNFHILVTGMGMANTERVVSGSLATTNWDAVITSGFAGGLNPALKTGTVVFEAEPTGRLYRAGLAAGAWPGKFHCAERVASFAAEKLALRQTTEADAVEMESGVIHRLARQKGIPSATVRVILDEAGQDLPLDFNQALTPENRLSPVKMAMLIGKSPRSIPRLIAFQKQVRHAASALAKALERILTELASG